MRHQEVIIPPIYVVLTLAIKGDSDGEPMIGWTRDDGHYYMSLVPDPPDVVVQQSKEFVGRTVDRNKLL